MATAAYLLARVGAIPAEALSTEERWRLVAHLHGLGWSDARIAEHTRQTEYTTARIRAGLGLAPNPLEPADQPRLPTEGRR